MSYYKKQSTDFSMWHCVAEVSFHFMKLFKTISQRHLLNANGEMLCFFGWNLSVCNFMLFAIKALNPSFQMSCLTVSIQFYAVKPWFKIVTVLNECWTWIKFNLIGFKLLNMSRSFKTKKNLTPHEPNFHWLKTEFRLDLNKLWILCWFRQLKCAHWSLFGCDLAILCFLKSF